MAEFSVNAQRFGPYKDFKFRVKWDGRYVAGFRKVGALTGTNEVIAHREDGNSSAYRKLPSRNSFEAIVLQRGLTHDTEFLEWANSAEAPLKDFVIIEVHNEAGQLALAYTVFRCRVSNFQPLPDLNANANAVAIETMALTHEGWECSFGGTKPA